MIIVGLTGGIGSGKTTVATMFKKLNVPVYIADVEAKKLMIRSKVIRRKLIALFGEEAYIDEKLNRLFLAQSIFNDKNLLQKMNKIVHPKVAKHFKRWSLKQSSPYVIKEVAILFENQGHLSCDLVITVVAPKSIRLERVIDRDDRTKKQVEAIMENQWTDEDKIELSDFVIENIHLEETERHVMKVHNEILKKAL